jgi:hypothetical protein
MPQLRKRAGKADRRDRQVVDGWVGQRPLTEAARSLRCSPAFLHQFITGKRELSSASINRWAEKIARDAGEAEELRQLFSRCKLEGAA